MAERMIDKLNSLYPMSKALEEMVKKITTTIEYQSGDFILQEGQICNKISLVTSGLVRSYYMNEEKEITSRFMEEGFIVTAWLSYYLQKPGHEYIVAIENTTLDCIDYKDIHTLFTEFPEANIIGRKQVEYAFYLSELRTQMLRKHTAEEKYKFFLDNHFSLLQRVSLKYIASYLGMSEETMSRVRTKFHKKQ